MNALFRSPELLSFLLVGTVILVDLATEAHGRAPVSVAAPELATASEAVSASSPSEPMPPVTLGRVARFEGFGRISDEGAALSTSLDIWRTSESEMVFDLSGHCENWLCFIGVSGTAIVTLVLEDGSAYRQVRLEIPETPARGWPWNKAPGRGAAVSVPFAVGPEGLAKTIKAVHWQFFDRAAPSPVTAEVVQEAAGLVLALL